jgi:hypothetical protein
MKYTVGMRIIFEDTIVAIYDGLSATIVGVATYKHPPSETCKTELMIKFDIYPDKSPTSVCAECYGDTIKILTGQYEA